MKAPADDFAGRWQTAVVLKRDVFSTVERGTFRSDAGELPGVLRRLDEVPWWSRPLAILLFNRERHALAAVTALGVAPPLLYADRTRLVRGYIPGSALKIARPFGDLAYFRSARAALRAVHRLRISHNDLAKEQNWLRSPDGRAYLLDFQLASMFSRRSRLFRIAAYEDLRHFLKHKRRYVPYALTAMEERVLAHKSLPSRIWMASGKKIYTLVTRGLLGFIDAEGGGKRMAHDVPAIETALQTSVGYLGAMGSRRTAAARRDRLRERGTSDESLARLMAPIGLDIGARTPEETAISICAEIIASRSGRTVTSLRDGDGPIH